MEIGPKQLKSVVEPKEAAHLQPPLFYVLHSPPRLYKVVDEHARVTILSPGDAKRHVRTAADQNRGMSLGGLGGKEDDGSRKAA
jgi:hypothetical protein